MHCYRLLQHIIYSHRRLVLVISMRSRHAFGCMGHILFTKFSGQRVAAGDNNECRCQLHLRMIADSLALAESVLFCISTRGRSALWRKRFQFILQPHVEPGVYWHRTSEYSSDVLAARAAARLAHPLIRPSMHVKRQCSVRLIQMEFHVYK